MEIADIIFIVELATGYSREEMINSNNGLAYQAKCIACMMVKEEGIKDNEQLAELFRVKRTTIYNYINLTDCILSIWPGMKGYDKLFKMLYLACNSRRVYFEERPELKLNHEGNL